MSSAAEEKKNSGDDPWAAFEAAVQENQQQQAGQTWPLSTSPLPENPPAPPMMTNDKEKSDLERMMDEAKRKKRIDPRTHG